MIVNVSKILVYLFLVGPLFLLHREHYPAQATSNVLYYLLRVGHFLEKIFRRGQHIVERIDSSWFSTEGDIHLGFLNSNNPNYL